MSSFEFIFTLFGLLLGLALAAGLGGLTRVLKVRRQVRIGWSTILLGLFASCDVVTFWMYGWTLRDALPLTWPVLFGGFVVTAVYYVAVSMVFPDEPGEWHDLDAYFDQHRRLVLGGILFCNVVLLSATAALGTVPPIDDLRTAVVTWSFFPVSLVAIGTRDRRVVNGCLAWLILLYPLSVAWT